jgi:GNAT superfamily N-acetyltransferase
VIRPCQAPDLPAIFEIINDAAAAYDGAIPEDCYSDPYMTMDELRAEAGSMTFYGFEVLGALAGVVGYQPIRDVTLIRHLYVRTANQRSGLGSALLSHVVDLTDTPRLLIGMWADAHWAIIFYRRHGFSLLADGDALLRAYWRIPDRQREASIVMGRELSGYPTIRGDMDPQRSATPEP